MTNTMNKLIEYDARLEKCPLPLVKTKLLLKSLTSGQQVRLLLSDPGSISDIPKLLTKQCIEFTQQQIDKQVIELLLVIPENNKSKNIND